MILPLENPRRYSLHGLSVELRNDVGCLDRPINDVMDAFSVSEWPEGFVPASGEIRRFETMDVLRFISPYAQPMPRPDQLQEVYQDGNRFWVVDDRWGMSEIDLQANRWRSWVLPNPTLDPVGCMEMAVTWPLAQLLPRRGLFLLPSVAVVCRNFGALIVCPFGLEAELRALVAADFRIIGQRWTAVREEDGRVAMLEMAGPAERQISRRVPGSQRVNANPWVDLTYDHPLSKAHHAFCDVVLMINSGRHTTPAVRTLTTGAAASALRKSWPLMELHPNWGYGKLPLRLAHKCRVCELQLSRNPYDLPLMIESLRPGKVTAQTFLRSGGAVVDQPQAA